MPVLDLISRLSPFTLATSALASGVGREFSQAINSVLPNQLPPYEEMLRCWFAGLVSDEQLTRCSKLWGVQIAPYENDYKDIRKLVWSRSAELHYPSITPDFARDLYYKWRIQPDWFESTLGIKSKFDEQWFLYNTRRAGLYDDKQRFAALLAWQELDLGSILSYWRRGRITLDALKEYLKIHGYLRANEVEALTYLTTSLPTPGDLIRQAAQRSNDGGIIERYNLNAGYDQLTRAYFRANGLDWAEEYQSDDGQTRTSPNWGESIWRTHWVYPSPMQAMEFFRRFNRDNVGSFRPQFPTIKEFTEEDVNACMEAANVPPGMREWFKAGSYAVLGVRQLTRLIRNDLVDHDKASQILQMSGFRKADADLESTAFIKDEKRRRYGALREDAKGKIKDAYQAGILDVTGLVVNLYRLSIDDAEEAIAFDGLPLADKVIKANGSPEVIASVASYKLEVQIKRVNELVKLYSEAYIKGILSRDQISSALASLGIVPDHIEELFQLWDLQRLLIHKEASAGEIIRWGKDGILSVDEVKARLLRLGYAPADADAMIYEAQQQLLAQYAKQVEKVVKDIDKQEQKTLKEIAALQKQALADKIKAAKQLSVAELMTAMDEKLLTEKEVKDRLIAQGKSSNDADILLEEHKQKQSAKAAKGGKTGAKGTSQAKGTQSGSNQATGGTVPAG